MTSAPDNLWAADATFHYKLRPRRSKGSEFFPFQALHIRCGEGKGTQERNKWRSETGRSRGEGEGKRKRKKRRRGNTVERLH